MYALFNVIFHNRDDHTKNFAYHMSKDGQWQLSPAYDVTYCPGPGGWHQMDVCGEALNIGKTHMLQLAAEADLSQRAASDLIDKRKNWRAHFTPDEPGVKCMVMDGWQELSGVSRPGQLNRGKNTTPLNQYWTALRTNGQTGMTTDLAEGEHLCGLAYVKRRFVRHFEHFKATLPSGLTLKGWKLEAGVPSVSYMAAVHWLETLVTCATTEELEALHHAAEQTGASRDEWDTRNACLDEAWKGRSFHRDAQHPKRKLLALDGNLFFEHVHQQPERYGYKPAETQQNRIPNRIRMLVCRA